jgi:hypothetical protein
MFPMMGAALGAQALGGLGGFLSGQKQAETADRRYENSQSSLLRQIGKTRIAYDKSEGLLKGNLAGVRKGYGDAFANLSTYGNSARQTVRSQGQQNLAGLAQNMASRGMGGTTVLDNAQRGIYSDTSRRLAEIDEGQGQMFANLGLQKTAALGAAKGDLANFYAQRNQAEISDRHDLISLWLNTIPQANNPAAGIGQLGGSMGQMYMLQQMMGGGA